MSNRKQPSYKWLGLIERHLIRSKGAKCHGCGSPNIFVQMGPWYYCGVCGDQEWDQQIRSIA